jgi:putative ABC transport system permease protein
MSTHRSDEDFDREIDEHLALETARLIEEGMTPAAARAAARRAFGNVTRVRERYYEARRVPWIDHLRQDARCAIRSLRRYPIAAAVAIVSLAGGIGATTVTLMIRDVIFRKPPPLYSDPRAVSRVQVGTPDRPIMPIGSYVPAPLYRAWSDTIGGLAAARPLRGTHEVRAGDRTDSVPVREVTPDLFDVLGVKPALGETLGASDRAGTEPAVLSYRLWQQLFDGRADAIGANIWIERRPFTVVGVLPERFWFSEMNSPIWTRLDLRPVAADDGLEVVTRRPAGVTPSMLEARLTVALAEYARTLPAAQRQLRLKISGIEGTPLGNQLSIALPYVLGTSVLLTLLIACANVAILMIAQWTVREHEIAIRASIGASRGRIVRALLTESVLIAIAGGALGVLATYALRAFMLQGDLDVRFFDLSIDYWILAQTAALALATGIVSGVAPALYETRRLHANPLRAVAGSDRVRQRWRNALVILEICVTVALLVVTAAMIDGYQRTRSAEMGFNPHPLMVAYVENPDGVPIGATLDALAGTRGVAAVAAATVAPYAGTPRQIRVATDASGSNAVPADRGVVTTAFFATLGVPLRAGRVFTAQDAEATHAAVVNETLARRLFKGQNAIGARVWIGETAHDIVGVVADYANNPLQLRGSDPKVFLPLLDASRAIKGLFFLVRADGDPAALVQPVRRQARDAAAGSTAPRAYTFDQIVAVMGQEMLVGTAPLLPLISIAALLTTAGIYGVLAFAIARRSRELAVRVAIGATSADIVRLVTMQSAKIVGVGGAAGLAATFALGQLVRASGGAGSVFDPPGHVFVAPALMLIVIAAIATWVPSRRATRIDPSVLLRTL